MYVGRLPGFPLLVGLLGQLEDRPLLEVQALSGSPHVLVLLFSDQGLDSEDVMEAA